MGGLFSRGGDAPHERGWGAVAHGVAAVGSSADSNQKRVLVKAQEYLPDKPTFVFSIKKAESQGCKAKFQYRAEVNGAMEFWLTVTRLDANQGWEHDLHLKWQASGGVPKPSDGTDGLDEQVAQMVAMGYSPEQAMQALQLKDGDLGAAASFIGACDIADHINETDRAGPLQPVAPSPAAVPEVVPEAAPLEMQNIGSSVAQSENPHELVYDQEKSRPLKKATALATSESILEPEPLAGFEDK